MRKLFFTLLFLLLIIKPVFNQTVKIDSIYSEILNRKIATTVILPSNYDTLKTYPVLYFLHWWGGDNQSFLSTNLINELKSRQLIVVTPNADTSWYVNSFSNPMNRYEDFMLNELFNYIDRNYQIDSKKQSIGGFSMGGYGALHFGFKHPERFKYIVDICGAINAPFYDIPLTTDSPLNFIINSVRLAFGDEKTYTPKSTDVFLQLKNRNKSVNQLIFIATAKNDEFDFIKPQHEKLIKELEKQKIKYQYFEFEGGHFDGKVINSFLPIILEKIEI